MEGTGAKGAGEWVCLLSSFVQPTMVVNVSPSEFSKGLWVLLWVQQVVI